MAYLAVNIEVIESEAGWSSKIDDYMVCLNATDAILFKEEFNSENNKSSTPDWYMYANGEPIAIELSKRQYMKLVKDKRVWWSELKSLK